MAQLTFPDNPTSGQLYTAENGYTYRYDDTALPGGVGVWLVDVPSAALSVTSGSIAGATTVGSVLTYTQGVASGGTPAYSYSWVWLLESTGLPVPGAAASATSITIPGSAIGDRIYVRLTATDSAPTPASVSGNTSFYPGAPSVITGTTFPNYTTTPAGAPNASPDATDLSGPSLYGIATGNPWADGTTTITATGNLQYRIGAGSWGQAGQTANNGNIVSLRWNPTAADAANNTPLSGTLTDGLYTNPYSLAVDNQPSAYTWNTNSNVFISTEVTSNVVNIAGINAPAELIYAPGNPNTLTNVLASVNGGPFVSVPTASPGLVINPANTAGTTATSIQLKGTPGSSLSTTYSITTRIGDGTTFVDSQWDVSTGSNAPNITTPTIQTPTDGSTGISIVGGVNITADAYTPNNGAGAVQTSSTWEVVKCNGLPSSAITGVGTINYSNFLTTSSSWFSASTDNTVPFLGATANFASSAGNATLSFTPGTPISGSNIWTMVGWGVGNVGWEYNINNTGWQDLYTTVRVSPQASTTAPAGWLSPPLSSSVWWDISSYSPITSIQSRYVGALFGTNGPGFYPLVVDGTQLVDNVVQLTLTDNTNLSSMTAGDTVKEYNSAGVLQDASGTIGSIDTVNNKITLSASSGTWNTSNFVLDTTVPFSAPTGTPTAPAYTAISGSPFSDITSPLTAFTVPQAALATGKTYYARVQYATTNTVATTSSFSPWSSFAT